MHIGFKSRALFFAISIPLILFLAVSCGGGGSDGVSDGIGSNSVNDGSDNSMSDADFIGTYRLGMFYIGFDDVPSCTIVSEIQSDGNGIYSLRNIFGPGGDANSEVYVVDSDGVFSLYDHTANGQLSYDGSIFHLVQTIGGEQGLALALGIRKGTGLSEADLYGSYHVATLSFAEAEAMPGIVVRRWRYEFDGIGTIGRYFLNPIFDLPVEFDYIVSDNGALSIPEGIGQVSPDGDIFFYVNTFQMAIGVRRSTGMSNDDLIGTYHDISMSDSDLTGVQTSRELIYADGNGSATSYLLESTGIAVIEDTFTFAVVNDAGEIHDDYGRQGQLSPDRSFFMIADDTSNEGSTSKLSIGILQP